MKKHAVLTSLADLHMHTTASDGIMSPQAVVNAVLLLQRFEPRLRVIAIADHDTMAGAWCAIQYKAAIHPDADLEIIPAAEISSADGHIVALDIREPVPAKRSAATTIAAIHEQGGFAIAAHPYAYVPFLKNLKGLRGLIADRQVGPLIDAIEVCNSNPTETLNNFFTRWVNARNLRRPEIGSSDSHFRSAIARATTAFPGSTAEDLKLAIAAGSTRAQGAVYGPVAFYEYLRDRMAWRRFCQNDAIHSHFIRP